MMDNTTSATEEITGISCSGLQEETLQESFLINLDYLTSSNTPDELLARSESLTENCPFEAGQGVYAARSMQSILLDRQIYDDLSACFTSPRIMNLDTIPILNCKLSPNPCNEKLVMIFDNDVPLDKIQFAIYDVRGKSVQLRNRLSKSQVEFNTLNLNNGIYHIEIFINKIKCKPLKFVVIH
jgi:hypothetical protein